MNDSLFGNLGFAESNFQFNRFLNSKINSSENSIFLDFDTIFQSISDS